MNRRTFAILCHLLRTVAGLSSTEIVYVEEIVVMFLHVLMHDMKNCKFNGNLYNQARQSCDILTSFFWLCLCGKFVTYQNVTIMQASFYKSTELPWGIGWDVHKGKRARSKSTFIQNAKGDFVYVLAGWEGSAADS
ncbi:retrotransposon protein [Cucumis melo var. makuwa]|uniref:Retrotransposon protein n=1 Tax=Cucumis melo var. makuwa TaxID=1194695 RepID=A0A5A7TF09_CUCMM|nr:retrotransposon protein [Cucumis melo var. makuwa]TYK05638.1 retrotransposon protein [Cucumis melo var. makuwa]